MSQKKRGGAGMRVRVWAPAVALAATTLSVLPHAAAEPGAVSRAVQVAPPPGWNPDAPLFMDEAPPARRPSERPAERLMEQAVERTVERKTERVADRPAERPAAARGAMERTQHAEARGSARPTPSRLASTPVEARVPAAESKSVPRRAGDTRRDQDTAPHNVPHNAKASRSGQGERTDRLVSAKAQKADKAEKVARSGRPATAGGKNAPTQAAPAKTTPGKAAPAKVTLARTHPDQAYARQGVRSAPSTGRAGAPAAAPVRPAGKAAASKVHPTGQVAKKAAGRSVEGAGGRTVSKPPVAGHSTGKPAGQARQAVQADAARENRETRSKAPRGARSTTPPPSRPLRRG